MDDSRRFSKRADEQRQKVEAAGKSSQPIGCPGIDDAPGNTLHSRIKAISPNLLKVLKKQ
jgi:hypothetical protein